MAEKKLADIPAGHERDEEIRKREDAFEEKAETLAAEQEVFRVDPKAIEPDNEILYWRDSLDVTEAQPDKAYAWVNANPAFHGRFIQKRLAQRWQLVQGNMPEAMELRQADGTRRLGDVVLMWTTKELYEQQERMQDYKRWVQQEGVSARLKEFAEQAGTVAYDASDAPEHVQRMFNQQQARSQARQIQDQWIREGRVPGMVMNQKRGRR